MPAPEVPGVVSAAEVRQTVRSLLAVQQGDGAIPWAVGQHVDAWNHVEAAMALLVGGEVEAAEAAYDWCVRTQRADGSWPLKMLGAEVVDGSGETNVSAYLAVGLWHHWLLRRDRAYVERLWPSVRRGLDFVCSMQLPFGGIAWSQEPGGKVNAEALLAGSSSIYQSLRAGLALADLAGEPQPAWELALARLRHALEAHRDLFLDKSAYSMDWYYPILAGPLRGDAARAVLAERWQEFVVDGLGCLCVNTHPWVTGAETCELVLALDNLGDRSRALRLLTDMQHLRDAEGRYWTGSVYDDGAYWPEEHTTFTAAAMVLAADALAHATPAAGIFRGDCLPLAPAPLAMTCGCPPVVEEGDEGARLETTPGG